MKIVNMTLEQKITYLESLDKNEQKGVLSYVKFDKDLTWFFHMLYNDDINYDIKEDELTPISETFEGTFGDLNYSSFQGKVSLFSYDSKDDLEGNICLNHPNINLLQMYIDSDNREKIIEFVSNMADSKEQSFIVKFLNGNKFDKINKYSVIDVMNV